MISEPSESPQSDEDEAKKNINENEDENGGWERNFSFGEYSSL